MELERRIADIIEPTLQSMGYDLVRVLMQGRTRPSLQIMAERKDEKGMTVDDCADISRAVSALLDVEDPIQGAYSLEVSSPGIDRPLVRPQDFDRFAGFEAKMESSMPVDGRKRFRGQLLGLTEDGAVRLLTETGEVAIPFDNVQRAKLVLTDELIAAAQREQEQ